MITFLLQEPFVPEGVTLSIEVSIYEASFIVPRLDIVLQQLEKAQQRKEQREYEAEKRDDATSNG